MLLASPQTACRGLLHGLLVTAALGSVLVSTTLASPPSIVARHTAPQSLVLHLRDLPASFGRGFTQSGVAISNGQVASVEFVSAATVAQHGRISGYQTMLVRGSKTRPFSVMDSVGLYRSVAGAHWQYRKFLSVTKVPPTASMLAMKGIGDEARGYILRAGQGAVELSDAGVYLRRGIYNARLDIFELGALRPANVLFLARLLDNRMRHAR